MRALVGLCERLTRGVLLVAEGSVAGRVLVLAVVAVLALLPGLASLPPTDRDESRFIQASRQMVESGDPVDIRFQDTPRWKKPVGIHWLQSASVLAAGGAEAPVWAYRLPSALGVMLAALLTLWALQPLIGLRGAILGGLMLASSVLVVAEGHLAKTDAVLLATVIAAQGALARIWLFPVRRFDWRHLVFWSALGGGVLIKGPVILLPVFGTVLWMCARDRSLREVLRLRLLPGLLLLAVIILPWLVAIGLRSGGGFFAASLGEDFLAKLGSGQEKHWGPPGYYLATIWASFWPWAPLMLFAAPLAWRLRREDAVGFLIGWVVMVWVPLELTPTKLPHYILPALPALCGLIGLWLVTPEKGPSDTTRLWLAAGLLAIPGLVLVLAAFVLLPLVEGTVSLTGLGLGLAALLVLAAAGRALAARRVTGYVGAALIAALLLEAAAFSATLPHLHSVFLSPRLVAARAAFDACSGQPLASVGYHEPSLVVAGGTPTRLIDAAEAARLLGREDGWLVFIEERSPGTLDRFVAESNLAVQIVGSVSGFHYNRGRMTTINLIARTGDPQLVPCVTARTGT